MWEPYRTFAQQHFPFLCQARALDCHKGTFGTVAIIGGSTGMSGAVIMAAHAALKLGAGKVKIGFLQPNLPLPVLELQPEIMLFTADELIHHSDITAWGIGCGLGLNDHARHLIIRLVPKLKSSAVVWDADALNLFSRFNYLQVAIAPQHIITPHPTEAARLLSMNTEDIQNDRLQAIQTLQQRYQCLAVLKGYQSLVANRSEQLYTNHSGNPGLATAGSGDILTGFISSLLAQGIDSYSAACAAVWLHGAAAEILALQEVGPIGMVATELIDTARLLRNQICT